MKHNSDILKTFSEIIKKIIWTLGINAFYVLIFIIILEIIFGGLIFYRFIFLAENNTFQIEDSSVIKLDAKSLIEINKKFQEREFLTSDTTE